MKILIENTEKKEGFTSLGVAIPASEKPWNGKILLENSEDYSTVCLRLKSIDGKPDEPESYPAVLVWSQDWEGYLHDEYVYLSDFV